MISLKLKTRNLILLTLSVLIYMTVACPSPAETVSDLGKPKDFTNDYTGTLSSSDISRLNSMCRDMRDTNSVEIAVVMINSTDGVSIESFAQELFQKWGIGNKQDDNGILILVALNDHKWRVQTGYGVEGTLTDSLAARIMENEAVGEFRNNNYGQGLINALGKMKSVMEGETYSGGEISPIAALGTLAVGLAVISLAILLIWLAVRIKCPRCGSQVRMTKDIEALSADYSHSGIQKRDFECKVCHHEFSRMTVIPMLVESTSSGSSSGGWHSGSSRGWGGGGSSFGGFGGGSSGGGGASGGW